MSKSLTTTDRASSLPDDGHEVTRELQAKTPADDDDVGELLAELCDETLTPAERLENQFALSNRWTLDDGLLETRVLRVLKEDPRVAEEPATNNDDGTDQDKEESVDLSGTAEELLHHLPASEEDLAEELGVARKTVRSTISQLQNKGVHVRYDYGFDQYLLESEDSPSGTTQTTQDSEESIYLVYWLPTEDVAVEEFEKPVPWNPDEYKFARLVEAIGYGPSTIDQLEGEAVVLDRTNGDWHVPDPAENEVHPAAYTDTPVAPPGTSLRTTTAHFLKEGKDTVRRIALHPYTLGTAAFLAGAVTAYTVYVVGGAVLGFLANLPEMLTDMVLTSAETADGEPTVDPEAIESLFNTVFNMTIFLTMMMFMLNVMRRMMTDNRRH